MGERDASPARPSRRRGSRFSKSSEPAKQDELKKAAEALKQEYKSLLQHLSHLHGIGTSYTDERALSMFAPNMQLPPQLKGLKEQEKERRERLKGLRDQLRKQKDSEPAGLADWFESDSGPFLQEKEDKPVHEAESNRDQSDDGQGLMKLPESGDAGQEMKDKRRKEDVRGSMKKGRKEEERGAGRKRSREHSEKNGLKKREGNEGRERSKNTAMGRRHGNEKGAMRGDSQEQSRREEKGKKQVPSEEGVRSVRNEPFPLKDSCGGEEGTRRGVSNEAGFEEVIEPQGDIEGCKDEVLDLESGISDKARKFSLCLSKLKELDSIITSDGLELWYNARLQSGGCMKNGEQDGASAVGELDAACDCNTSVELDQNGVSGDKGSSSQFRKDALHAIKSARSDLVKLLLELDPDFEPPLLPGTLDVGLDSAPVDKVKSRVVIKRKSFFPLPRLKPKEDNPDFTIVRPICVPTIVFNENGSAESVHPRGVVPHAPFLPKQQADGYLAYENETLPGDHPNHTRSSAPPPTVSSDELLPRGNNIGAASGANPSMRHPSNPRMHHCVPDDNMMQSLGSSIHASGFQNVGHGQAAHQFMIGSQNNLPSAPHLYGVRPPAPPPRPPPRPPNHSFMIRPPPRPPPRMSAMPGGESHHYFGPGVQNHLPPQSGTGASFRVPPPPILDLTTQGPEYEVGKDEEDILMKSPKIQQMPPPPPPLTTHPMFSTDARVALPRTAAPHLPHGGVRSTLASEPLSQECLPPYVSPPVQTSNSSVPDHLYLQDPIFRHN